jgi:hypothetical protein
VVKNKMAADHSKTGQFVRFSNGFVNQFMLDQPNHSKTGQIGPVFEWSTSLDRFIYKGVIKRKYYNKIV